MSKQPSKPVLPVKTPSVTAMLPPNWRELFSKAKIDYRDTPFSLGYDILFVSNNKLVKPRFRTTYKSVKTFVNNSKATTFYASFDDEQMKLHTIYLSPAEKDKTRIIELLAHEVSHMVDHILLLTNIQIVDTKVRSYIWDHILGKLVYRLTFTDHK